MATYRGVGIEMKDGRPDGCRIIRHAIPAFSNDIASADDAIRVGVRVEGLRMSRKGRHGHKHQRERFEERGKGRHGHSVPFNIPSFHRELLQVQLAVLWPYAPHDRPIFAGFHQP